MRFTKVLKLRAQGNTAAARLRDVRFTRVLKPIRLRENCILIWELCCLWEALNNPAWGAASNSVWELCCLQEVLNPRVTFWRRQTYLRVVWMCKRVKYLLYYCLNYHVLTRPPLILSPNLSVNCSDVPMLESCDDFAMSGQIACNRRHIWELCCLQEVLNTGAWIVISLKVWELCCLREVLNSSNLSGHSVAVWELCCLQEVLNRNVHQQLHVARLRVVLFTRGLKPRLRHPSSERCLRAVRFTMVLKLRRWLCRFIICLRAMRFTKVLKLRSHGNTAAARLRAAWFTWGKCPHLPLFRLSCAYKTPLISPPYPICELLRHPNVWCLGGGLREYSNKKAMWKMFTLLWELCDLQGDSIRTR